MLEADRIAPLSVIMAKHQTITLGHRVNTNTQGKWDVCFQSADQTVNYKDLMALVQLTHRAGPSVRLIVCKRVRKHSH